MRRLVVDARMPAADVLADAADVIAAGGVVAFPTDTLYGLAVDPFNAAAVDRLFTAKRRPTQQAVALVAADLAQVEAWLGELPAPARRVTERLWPGPVTVLIHGPGPILGPGPCSDPIHRAPLAPGIVAADGTVGVRVPDHAVARALCRAAGRPLTATSANATGEAPSADPDQVARALAGRIDLLLDAGTTRGGAPSTLVDATSAELRLVRAGAVDWDTIQRCAREE